MVVEPEPLIPAMRRAYREAGFVRGRWLVGREAALVLVKLVRQRRDDAVQDPIGFCLEDFSPEPQDANALRILGHPVHYRPGMEGWRFVPYRTKPAVAGQGWSQS